MMDIDEEDILRAIANGGSIDYSIWPALSLGIVSRIEKITHNEFPIPNLPPPAAATTIPPSISHPPLARRHSEPTENFLSPLPSSPLEPPSSPSSQDNKENAPIAPRIHPPPTSAPASFTALPPGTLPPQIASMLTEITSTLKSTFPNYPPHTLQRLAELVLTPKHHYRTLPTYLHALDRVVHVTSGLNVYPLPPAIPDAKTTSLLSNGISDAMAIASPSPFAAPGSDEALGGALLTPIPWLQPNQQIGGPSQSSLGTPGARSPNSQNSGLVGPVGGGDLEGEVRTESTETIEGPNGIGSIETVSVSVNGIPSMGARGVGVTQGELLRQEQRAGVVPVSQLVPSQLVPSHHVHSGNPHPQVHRRASPSSGSEPSPNAATPPASSSDSPEAERKSQSPPNAHTPNSSSSSTSSSSSSGSNTNNPIADAENALPLGSIIGTDEEKPHARGPEEIGPEDMGPQHGSTSLGSATTIGGPGGIEMQGIDVEAAVGRKAVAVGGRGSSKSPPKTEDAPGDKMDVEEEASESARSTEDSGAERESKREAEDEPQGAAEAKKLKEDKEWEIITAAEVPEQGQERGERDAEAEAMDTSSDGKGEDGGGKAEGVQGSV
ncbi:uncharacterized protein F4812DRAFT_443792 [Daldinia caldariorum]|uniref:uncharacterized protein n=1 Tax=Daldinia caldariorum TaxID=326644 RepID=UPI002007BC13|nr:uncharacterized protein F4812DRAFT_443792 [Daldinia caldariorum]KAI1464212.1 hypothetical protein F4812DRAFT_443792 [Daldinia caldariorum]